MGDAGANTSVCRHNARMLVTLKGSVNDCVQSKISNDNLPSYKEQV
jgi:hypothetical protein